MKGTLRRIVLMAFLAALFGLALAQEPEIPPPAPRAGERPDVILPNGKSQRDEILKAEREENIKDAARLASLADELKEALEREDRFVFSISTLKKTEEIEKLAKKIRSRMEHN
jgi:hypothetical protein